MFKILRHSDTCNLVKSCTKHSRPDLSQQKLTEALTSHFFFNYDIRDFAILCLNLIPIWAVI